MNRNGFSKVEVFIALAVVALLASIAYATGACTYTVTKIPASDERIKFAELACTGDAGGTADTTISGFDFHRLIMVEYDGGTTAPSANADLALTSAFGHDYLKTLGVNMLNNTTSSYIIPATNSHFPAVYGNMIQNVTNTSVANATYTVRYWFQDMR
jgi:hypothetical protein